ncbi:hypothetical protein N2152v2_007926 [Parachlorella kessleri]
MAADDSQAALLIDEEDQGWDDLEDVEDQVTDKCTVVELLDEHPNDIIRYVQDHLAFPAFKQDQILTLGSNKRHIDYEREWRQHLENQKWSKDRSGWANDVCLEALVVTIKDVAKPGEEGLLQPLLKRYMAQRCSYAVFALPAVQVSGVLIYAVLHSGAPKHSLSQRYLGDVAIIAVAVLPAVQAVITFKWNTFARRLLLVELGFFMLWLVGFNTFTILFQDEDLSLSLRALLGTWSGRATVAAELLALAGMAPFLVLEVGTLPTYKWRWFNSWTLLDVACYAIQFVITGMHLARWHLESSWLSILPAVQYILLVFKLQYFSQAFRPTRFAFLDTVREVTSDLKYYLLFLLLVMWGFGSAFHIVFRRNQEDTDEYDTMLHAFLAMFEHQYGDLELKPMYQSKVPVAATCLAVVYTFIMGSVLINLLIGLVISSLDKVMDNQEMKLLLNKARVIDELEGSMPRWLLRRNPHWYPSFIHLLRINPEKLDKVEVDCLWSLLGEDSPAAAQAKAQKQREAEEGEVDDSNDDYDDYDDGQGGPAGQFIEEEGVHSRGPIAKGKGGGPTTNGRMEGAGADGGAKGSGRGDRELILELRQQLEEQGQLLRQLCSRLGPPEP